MRINATKHILAPIIATVLSGIIVTVLSGIILNNIYGTDQSSNASEESQLEIRTPTDDHNIVTQNADDVINNKYFLGSIFDLVTKISDEPIVIQKQKYFEDVYGLIMNEESGFIKNIKKVPEAMDPQYGVYVEIIKNNGENQPSIECRFTRDWEKAFSDEILSKKIIFTGTINGEKNYNSIFSDKNDIPLIYLKDCTAKPQI